MSQVMKLGWTRWAATALAGAAMCVSVSAAAQTPEEFYQGQTVTILVGSPPGGGYDAYARLLAPYIAERLGAEVVVDNRPGGGGLLALSMLADGSQDGLTLMHASAEGAIMSQLVDREGVRWDVGELNWLARTAEEPKVLLFGPESPLQTVEDAMNADVVTWSATGPADNISDVAAVLSHALGINSEIITGYQGARDMSLAVVNGEVDAGILSASSASRLVEGGQLRAIAIIHRNRTAYMPDVPTIFELVDISEEDAWWIDFRAAIGEPHRAMVTGPGVPEDRVEYLRQVMEDVLTDPEVIAEGEESGRRIGYLPGAELQQLIVETYDSAAGDRLEEVRRVMLEDYL
ncbi:MAG: tripartite tricarboxylate transporter substrate binding protein [Azospirillaceae bacterium]